jgi:predicted aspartyl protease
MGITHTDITLVNTLDEMNFKNGGIKESDVRKVDVWATADTGAGTLVINENIRKALGLEIQGEKPVHFGDGSSKVCKRTEPVEVRWKDRYTTCRPILIPELDKVLLGAIPMEDLDLIVNPVTQTVEGANGDVWMGYCY